MTRQCFRKLSVILFLLNIWTLFAQEKSAIDKYVHLDLPVGYEITEKNDTAVSYNHPLYNTKVDFMLIPHEKYNSSKEALSLTLKKLKARFTIDSFIWLNRDCSIAQIKFTTDDTYEGWAMTCETPDQKYYIFSIGYVCHKLYKNFSAYILSGLNSIWIEPSDYFMGGIVMEYVYPKEGSETISIKIDEKDILSRIDKSDKEASQYLVDMEYKVLKYSASNKYFMEARKRLYRTIFRDNYIRVEPIITDIYETFYENKKNLNDKEKIQFLQKILTWQQNNNYTRANSIDESDITSFTGSFTGQGNDCDSRSLVLNAFAFYLGVDSVLYISTEFKHAMCGINIDAPGQKFINNDKYYLLGETTAKVTWGTIFKEHAQQDKWDCIYLY